jgi:hypothetical protein
MAFSLTVHEYTRIPGTLEVKLVRTRPYIRLAHRTEGAAPECLYVQEGHVWDEGGAEITSPPDWFGTELAKCSPAALAEVGWKPRETLSLKKG